MALTTTCRRFFFYLATISNTLFSAFSSILNLHRVPILFKLLDSLLSLYYRSCGFSSCVIDIDDGTSMHFWITTRRKSCKQNLVLVHGSGSTSAWQFHSLVRSLSRSYNLYIPDLIFFGKSYTKKTERSDRFQARCVAQGLTNIGIDKFSLFGISYGAYVSYWMAYMYPAMVDKLVLVSCGIGCTNEQRKMHLETISSNPQLVFVPETTDDARLLVRLTMYKADVLKAVPDFILKSLLEGLNKDHRKEKRELLEHLLLSKAEPDIPKLSQETLLIWGDKDMVFPVEFAHQLHRHLGPKAKLEIIKDTGHALNYEAANELIHLIKSFIN